MDKKYYILIAAIAIIVGILYHDSGKTKGFNTPYSNYPQNISSLASTTLLSAETLQGSTLTSYSSMQYTPNTASVTLTLPATSTIPNFISSPGQFQRFVIFNATGTTAITVTVAAGTGMTIQTSTTTNILPGQTGILDFYRKINSDMIINFSK